QVTGTGLSHLVKLPHFKKLDLASNRFTDAGMAHLNGLVRLESLSLPFTKVSDAGLGQLTGLKSLRNLTLPTGITDAGVHHLAPAAFPELRNLSFTNSFDLSGAGLAPLAKLPKLETLDLFATTIRDNNLAALGTCVQLKSLTAPQNTTDAMLADLKGLRK